MQVLACNPLSMQCSGIIRVPRPLGRRELCFDGISSICSHSPKNKDSSGDVVFSKPALIQRNVKEQTSDLGEVVSKRILFTTRRMLIASLFVYSWYHPSRYLSGLHCLALLITFYDGTTFFITSYFWVAFGYIISKFRGFENKSVYFLSKYQEIRT